MKKGAGVGPGLGRVSRQASHRQRQLNWLSWDLKLAGHCTLRWNVRIACIWVVFLGVHGGEGKVVFSGFLYTTINKHKGLYKVPPWKGNYLFLMKMLIACPASLMPSFPPPAPTLPSRPSLSSWRTQRQKATFLLLNSSGLLYTIRITGTSQCLRIYKYSCLARL